MGLLILIDAHLATPYYNTALLCEMGSMDRHLHTIYSATEGFPGMTDAIALCKVWARQRGLDKVGGWCQGEGVTWSVNTPLLSSHRAMVGSRGFTLPCCCVSYWN